MIFKDTAEAAEILGVDDEFAQTLKTTMAKLDPIEIGGLRTDQGMAAGSRI